MKTFEERYTAWIDGELDGSAVIAFEQELVHRATSGEAVADKAGAMQLRSLLQTHLQAPALTNPDFFNHQLRERIDAEGRTFSRRKEGSQRAEPAIFAWGLARLIGLGAMSLFAAAALYYGMMPSHPGALSDPAVASNAPAVARPVESVGDANVVSPGTQATAADNGPSSDGSMQLAFLSPTPSPIEASPDIKTYVPARPTDPTTITPLHYSQPDVNLLWFNGPGYLPSYPVATASPAPVLANPIAPAKP